MTILSDELRAKLFQQLSRHEDIRLSAYQDSKSFWTIGIGHCIDSRITFDPEMERVYRAGPITIEDAKTLFELDLDNVIRALDRNIPWWQYLPEIQKRILIDMCFNLGIGNLLHFHKFLMALYDGDNITAAKEMENSDWYNEVGDRSRRLKLWMISGVETWDKRFSTTSI